MRLRFNNAQQKIRSRFFEGDEPSVDTNDLRKYRNDINDIMSEIEKNMRNMDNLSEKDLKSFLTSARLFNSSLKINGTFKAIKRGKKR